jgi:hypothetical protein
MYAIIPELRLQAIVEVRDAAEDSAIVPTWTAVDAESVKSAKEVWEDLASNGWKVEVWGLSLSY